MCVSLCAIQCKRKVNRLCFSWTWKVLITVQNHLCSLTVVSFLIPFVQHTIILPLFLYLALTSDLMRIYIKLFKIIECGVYFFSELNDWFELYNFVWAQNVCPCVCKSKREKEKNELKNIQIFFLNAMLSKSNGSSLTSSTKFKIIFYVSAMNVSKFGILSLIITLQCECECKCVWVSKRVCVPAHEHC